MEKRRFLYYNLKNIDKNKNDLIYNYIINNSIDYNENSNGLLLNLSIISEEHINKLYDLYNLKEKKVIYDLSKFETQDKKNTKEKKKKQYKKYECDKLEKLILNYS